MRGQAFEEAREEQARNFQEPRAMEAILFIGIQGAGKSIEPPSHGERFDVLYRSPGISGNLPAPGSV